MSGGGQRPNNLFKPTPPEGPVRFLLVEIERAIEAVKPHVHGEAWYDKQPPEA